MRATSQTCSATKRATDVSLAEDILVQARALRINISQAAEAGITQAIARKRAEQWLAENHEAIESSNYAGVWHNRRALWGT